jgi:leucine dehydrogenase
MVLKIEDITEILSGKKQDPRFAANKEFDRHETIVFAHDPDIRFKAFIAVHNTARGPGLGGCRYSLSYASDDEAITDVLRLSKGMTYKNSLAQLDLGGGKSVIVGQPGCNKPTHEMMMALGRAVESLGGKYVTAEDMNTGEEDMMAVWSQTKHVTGIPLEKIASFPSGFDPKNLSGANPSPYTAHGTFWGIKAAVRHKMGRDDLKGVTVALKGAAGAVAAPLCRALHKEGAILVMSDFDLNERTPAHLRDVAKRSQERLAALAKECGNAKVVSSDEIMTVETDVFAPCARGADINDSSLPGLKAKIVAGCANNVLAEPRHAEALRARGILYAPDYAINAGGVICAGMQYLWHVNPKKYPLPTHATVQERAQHIHDVLLEIFRRADAEGKNTAIVADTVAEEGFRGKKDLSAVA